MAIKSRIDALKAAFERAQNEKDIDILTQESISWFYKFHEGVR